MNYTREKAPTHVVKVDRVDLLIKHSFDHLRFDPTKWKQKLGLRIQFHAEGRLFCIGKFQHLLQCMYTMFIFKQGRYDCLPKVYDFFHAQFDSFTASVFPLFFIRSLTSTRACR